MARAWRKKNQSLRREKAQERMDAQKASEAAFAQKLYKRGYEDGLAGSACKRIEADRHKSYLLGYQDGARDRRIKQIEEMKKNKEG